MAEIPHVAFHAFVDRPTTVMVHLGDKVRMFVAESKERAEDLIKKVMIAEFGVTQAEAEPAAAAAVDKSGEKSDAVAHVALLQEQLADNDKQLTEAINARIKAESDLKLAQHEITELKKASFVASGTISDMEAVQMNQQETDVRSMTPPEVKPLMPVGETQPHDPNGPNVPGTSAASELAAKPQDTPPASGGGVSTPVGETPPAETSQPQIQTGPAPTSAGTGGGVG